MASSPTGSAANGLNLLGGAVGLAGNLITSAQGKQDKRISEGQEDPALAALRKRLAAQNAQTAMSVAASQQGVNPALAQRNAQQALAQQQVQTNAQLAQGNLQSTLASRAATRGQQHQQIAGTAMGLGQGLVGLGTSMGAQKAYEASGAPTEGGVGLTSAPVPGSMPQEGAAGLGSSLAVQGAAGLSAPPPSQLAAPVATTPATPVAASLPGQLQMRGGEPHVMGMAPSAGPQALQTPQLQEQPLSPEAAAFQATLPNGGLNPTLPAGPSPAGQIQMRGAEPQTTAESAPMQAQAPQPVQTSQVQEQSVAQPGPAQPPAQAAAAPEALSLSTTQQVQMLDEQTMSDPMNSSLDQAAANAEARGNPQIAEVLRRALLQRAGVL